MRCKGGVRGVVVGEEVGDLNPYIFYGPYYWL